MATFRDRFFTPRGGAGDHVAARHRAVRRRCGRRRSSPASRSPRPPASARWRGAAGCWRPCRAADAVGTRGAVELSEPWRTLRDAGRGRQAALRPGRRDRCSRARCASGCSSSRAASTTASTSRGGSPAAATSWSARSARSTPPSAERELAELRGRSAPRTPSPAEADTIDALEAQLASAERLVALADRSRDRLRLLDARFDELVARTVEVSVGTGDTDVLGNDVDGLVSELESLRIAMEETDRAAQPS